MKYIMDAEGHYFITQGIDIKLSSQYKVFDYSTDFVLALEGFESNEERPFDQLEYILDTAIYLTLVCETIPAQECLVRTGRTVLVEHEDSFRMSFSLDAHSIEYILEYSVNEIIKGK